MNIRNETGDVTTDLAGIKNVKENTTNKHKFDNLDEMVNSSKNTNSHTMKYYCSSHNMNRSLE